MITAAQQELLNRFKRLARTRVFIRTVYAPDIKDNKRVRTSHRLITATMQGGLYIARVNFLHDIAQVLTCRECSLAEPPHEIQDDEMLWNLLSRHAGYSDVTSEDPLLVQMDVLSQSRCGKRDRTSLNFLVDLVEAMHFLIYHKDTISRAEWNHPSVILCDLFVERLEGFLEEKLRQLNALIKGFNSISPGVSQE